MRIVVVGTTGAGKTTLAKALAAELALPYIELDALHWEAGWQALTQIRPEEFVHRAANAIAADAWVLDGNYESVRNMVWTPSNTPGLARLRPVCGPLSRGPPFICPCGAQNQTLGR